jgi:hypothetical protein
MEAQMRAILAASVCILMLAAIPSQAAPLAPKASLPQIGTALAPTLIANGCGPGWHRNRWRDRWGYWHGGRCVPN